MKFDKKLHRVLQKRILFVSLAAVLIVGALLFWQVSRVLESQIQEKSRFLVDGVSAQISDELTERADVLNIFAKLLTAEEIIVEPEKQQAALDTVVEEFDVDATYVGFAKDGSFEISPKWDDADPDFDVRTRPWYTAAVETGGVTYIEPNIDARTGYLTLSVAAPIYDPENPEEVIAVLGMDIFVEKLTEALSNLDLAGVEGEQIYIIDEDGKFIVHPNPALVLVGNAFEDNENGEIIEGLVKNGEWQGVSHEKLYTIVGFIPEANWYIVFEIPTRVIYQPLVATAAIFIFGSLLMIFALVVTVNAVSRHISKPIVRLSHAARGVADRSYGHRLPIPDRTELGYLTEQFNEMICKIEERDQLELALDEEKESSRTDALTQLGNRLRYNEELKSLRQRAIRASEKNKKPIFLSLILLDIDHFKHVNDTYGHTVGDTCLKKVAEVLRECARETDVVTRPGGEEFVVLLPNTSLEDAANSAERIRTTLEVTEIIHEEEGKKTVKLKVTASLGVSCFDGKKDAAKQPEDLYNAADEALYRAKESGRNRVEKGKI